MELIDGEYRNLQVGDVVSLPDQPGVDLVVVAQGDGGEILLKGHAAGGSRLYGRLGMQFRRTNLDVTPAGAEAIPEDAKERLRNSVWTVDEQGFKEWKSYPRDPALGEPVLPAE